MYGVLAHVLLYYTRVFPTFLTYWTILYYIVLCYISFLYHIIYTVYIPVLYSIMLYSGLCHVMSTLCYVGFVYSAIFSYLMLTVT